MICKNSKKSLEALRVLFALSTGLEAYLIEFLNYKNNKNKIG